MLDLSSKTGRNKLSDIFFANENTLTLHVRVTKNCNADCSYCSSFENNQSRLMSLDDLRKSVKFIKNKILSLSLGGKRDMLTVQYVGGEILTVPHDYLKEFSQTIKTELSPLFKNFRHGVQSNLIGSYKKIVELSDLFSNNIGTSYDNFTNQRTVNKNPEKYKTIFLKNASNLKRTIGKSIDGIVVVDYAMKEFIHEEISLANQKKYNITLRPVFYGGSEVEKISVDEMQSIYEIAFDNWFLKQNILIEPFASFTQKRIYNLKNNPELKTISGCASQHNCAYVSLNLEPNGDLYVCLDLADSKHLKLGNSIKEVWNDKLFNEIAQRSYKLKTECYTCSYFKECQGGCMKEAVEQSGDMYGKTQYCQIWKSLFAKIDQQINAVGFEKVENWINTLQR